MTVSVYDNLRAYYPSVLKSLDIEKQLYFILKKYNERSKIELKEPVFSASDINAITASIKTFIDVVSDEKLKGEDGKTIMNQPIYFAANAAVKNWVQDSEKFEIRQKEIGLLIENGLGILAGWELSGIKKNVMKELEENKYTDGNAEAFANANKVMIYLDNYKTDRLKDMYKMDALGVIMYMGSFMAAFKKAGYMETLEQKRIVASIAWPVLYFVWNSTRDKPPAPEVGGKIYNVAYPKKASKGVSPRLCVEHKIIRPRVHEFAGGEGNAPIPLAANDKFDYNELFVVSRRVFDKVSQKYNVTGRFPCKGSSCEGNTMLIEDVASNCVVMVVFDMNPLFSKSVDENTFIDACIEKCNATVAENILKQFERGGTK